MELKDIKSKEEAIEILCKGATYTCLNPKDIWCYKELKDKFKFEDDDFVRIVDENIQGAIMYGSQDWKPKFTFTEEDLKKTKEREEYKDRLWRILFERKDKQIFKSIESNKVYTWEQLEKILNNTIL